MLGIIILMAHSKQLLGAWCKNEEPYHGSAQHHVAINKNSLIHTQKITKLLRKNQTTLKMPVSRVIYPFVSFVFIKTRLGILNVLLHYRIRTARTHYHYSKMTNVLYIFSIHSTCATLSYKKSSSFLHIYSFFYFFPAKLSYM